MLARLQSLYLFVAAILAFSSMFFPFWSYMAESRYLMMDFSPFAGASILHVFSLYVSSIVSPLTAVISIAAVFLYKNRALQSKLIMLLILLFLVDIFSGLTAAHFVNEHLAETFGSDVEHAPGAGFFILLPLPLLFWLAMRGVKKDEKIAGAYKRL